MSGEGTVQLTFEPVEISRPTTQSPRVAAPARRAALETAIRHEVLYFLGRNLRKPLLTLRRLGQFHLVQPEYTGALEPELEPTRGSWQVEPGSEEKLEPLPARAG